MKNKEQWKEYIAECVHGSLIGDKRSIDRWNKLAEYLEEADQAQELLFAKGYGEFKPLTGSVLLEIVNEVPLARKKEPT